MQQKICQDSSVWLNEQLFETIFEKSENDKSIKVMNVNVKPATNKGDNYISEMWRVYVEFFQGSDKNLKKTSVIVKVRPMAEGFQKEMAIKMETFETEISMMMDVLKQMDQKLGGKNPLCPRGLYCQTEDPVYLVMEDLVASGYEMGNRLVGLDLQHCILAIQGLARFHAASIAVCENNPNLINRYQKGTFSSETCKVLPSMENFFVSNAKALANEIMNWPEIDKKCAKKLLDLSDNMYKLAIKYLAPHEEGFDVLNHGDYWLNNMMFKYDDSGKPISHMMVDFQVPMYTTPVLDLCFFFSTSMTENVYDNDREKILQEYHKVLTKTMKKIGCKKQSPNLEKLKVHLNNRAILEMILAISFLPIYLADKNEVLSADEIMGENENPNPGFKSTKFRKILSKRMPVYEKFGFLDVEC